MADDPWLEIVSGRVQKLEDLVFGDQDKDACYPKCIETLGAVNNKLNSSINGKPKFNRVLTRLDEIEKYMDPKYVDRLTLTDEAKMDILISEEDWIKKQVEDMEKLQSLQEILNSEHLKVIPSLTARFQQLSQKHIEQQDKVGELTEDVKKLMTEYNTLITLLSKEFVMWDESVTKVERADLAKKGKL